MYLVFTRMPGDTTETVGNSGLCCCVCLTTFERWLTPLCVVPVVGRGRDWEICVNREIGWSSHSSMCCLLLLSCFSMAGSLDIVFAVVLLTTVQRAGYKVKQVALHWLSPHRLISLVLVVAILLAFPGRIVWDELSLGIPAPYELFLGNPPPPPTTYELFLGISHPTYEIF